MKKIIFCLTLSIISQLLFAQTSTPTYNFSNGIGIIAPDSLFSFNLRFRMQARSGYSTISESNLNASEIEARIRRMRIRFEGFAINPKINYYVQLSFSRGDMDWTDNDNSAVNSSPNIVRDAVVIYKPNHNLSITFGQTKLPGNRQRVVSSGELQFADRSIVNSTFNIDRDFGAQFAYSNNISFLNYVIKGAISSGEGRNSNLSDPGLAYTGRIELLPFGKFTNKGDYFEGDLEREKTPKISIAGGYHHNDHAMRTGGTTGKDLFAPRTIKSFIADFLLKYRGLALSAEYINRNAENPITLDVTNKKSTIYVGEGKMIQLSYLFSNNFEIAGRYAITTPYSSIIASELQKEETGIGVTKYLRKHRVKLQGYLFHNESKNVSTHRFTYSGWTGMFQIELGI